MKILSHIAMLLIISGCAEVPSNKSVVSKPEFIKGYAKDLVDNPYVILIEVRNGVIAIDGKIVNSNYLMKFRNSIDQYIPKPIIQFIAIDETNKYSVGIEIEKIGDALDCGSNYYCYVELQCSSVDLQECSDIKNLRGDDGNLLSIREFDDSH